MYGVLPQDSKENQWQMVSAKRDHWQTRSDERSGEPVGGLVRIKPRRLLLDVGKPRQSIGRVYELRAHGEAGVRPSDEWQPRWHWRAFLGNGIA